MGKLILAVLIFVSTAQAESIRHQRPSRLDQLRCRTVESSNLGHNVVIGGLSCGRREILIEAACHIADGAAIVSETTLIPSPRPGIDAYSGFVCIALNPQDKKEFFLVTAQGWCCR